METITGTKVKHWRLAFLDGLRSHGMVTQAAIDAGIDRNAAYYERQRDPTFAQEWTDALDRGVDTLEDVAKKRAYEGSDTLLIFLLKAHRPEKYREIARSIQVSVTPDQVEQMSDDELDRLINTLRTGARGA